MRNTSVILYALRAVIATGLMAALLFAGTNGFAGFTYESLRRSTIADTPVLLSNWKLEDANGLMVSLTDFNDDVLLVDFIFTRCQTICRSLGSRYRQLQQIIEQEELKNVRLLSISIDPEFDTPERLALYRQAHGGAVHSWTVARPVNENSMNDILAETGLRVIPDPIWGLAHSDAIHIVTDSALIRIEAFDSTALDSLMRNSGDS